MADLRELDRLAVFGRVGGLQIYELLDMADQVSAAPEWVEFYEAGLAFFRAGDFTAAMRDFEKASALNSQDPESFYQLALAERAKGDAEKSVRDLSRALELGATGWSRRAQAQEMLREWRGK